MGYNIEKPNMKELNEYWEVGIGLQQVDDLEPSKYLLELKEKNINNILTNEEIEELLYDKYANVKDEEALNQKQCDIVANRITKLLSLKGSSLLIPEMFAKTHEFLFENIFDFAGKFRKYNITKDEPILNGDTVRYANYFSIKETLDYDMKIERERDYSKYDKHTTINYLTDFVSRIWQVHPFLEGNTRTTAVFIEQYINQLGFKVNNEMFAKHSKYFRNALVRSSYYNNDVSSNNDFLKKFFINLLYDGNYNLSNKDLILTENFKDWNKR